MHLGHSDIWPNIGMLAVAWLHQSLVGRCLPSTARSPCSQAWGYSLLRLCAYYSYAKTRASEACIVSCSIDTHSDGLQDCSIGIEPAFIEFNCFQGTSAHQVRRW